MNYSMCNLGAVCCPITPGPSGHLMLITFWMFGYSSKKEGTFMHLMSIVLFKVSGASIQGGHST